MVNLAETCDALQRSDAASLEAQDEWRRAIAQLAQFDQNEARLRDELIANVVSFADRVVAGGKAILKKLVLPAEREQIVQRLDAARSASSSEEETSATSALLASGDRYASPDAEAREFVKKSAAHLEFWLEQLDECLADEEFELARVVGQQVRRISAAMREISETWPWMDEGAIQESWRQYQNGQLMDFETFKHELLKAAE
jgi:hypothetical protein